MKFIKEMDSKRKRIYCSACLKNSCKQIITNLAIMQNFEFIPDNLYTSFACYFYGEIYFIYTPNIHSELSFNTRIENFEDFYFLCIKIDNMDMIRWNLLDI